QAICPEANINNTDDLKNLYPQAEVIPLTKSYRSTFEIMRFAASILNKNEEPNTFLRHGEEVVVSKNTNPAEEVIKILRELPPNYNTVGILLPTIAEAKSFHEKIKSHAKLIDAESNNFEQGIMVMAAPFAKGLEFDVVICPAFKTPKDFKEQKLFYLICTRALHRLFVIEE
ncbi:MAG: helicase, partial [Clostridiales bacterium]|nr:helicase [Clostridiales bacterium]